MSSKKKHQSHQINLFPFLGKETEKKVDCLPILGQNKTQFHNRHKKRKNFKRPGKNTLVGWNMMLIRTACFALPVDNLIIRVKEPDLCNSFRKEIVRAHSQSDLHQLSHKAYETSLLDKCEKTMEKKQR